MVDALERKTLRVPDESFTAHPMQFVVLCAQHICNGAPNWLPSPCSEITSRNLVLSPELRWQKSIVVAARQRPGRLSLIA